MMKNLTSFKELLEAINKNPILIVSTPRSGSTLLKNKISNHYKNFRSFSEPDQSSETMAEFLPEYYSGNDSYIIKAHSSYICNPYEGKPAVYPKTIVDDFLHSDRFFKVAVKRKDIVEQIGSFYIALERDKWHYDDGKDSSFYAKNSVTIDESGIKFAIKMIDQFYYDFSRFDHLNHCIYYEDIFTPGERSFMITPPPTNYVELLNAITDLC